MNIMRVVHFELLEILRFYSTLADDWDIYIENYILINNASGHVSWTN